MFEGFFVTMAKNLPLLLFNSVFKTTPEVKLYFVEIIKSRRSYGFLITEELIFWLLNFGIYFHFLASLKA